MRSVAFRSRSFNALHFVPDPANVRHHQRRAVGLARRLVHAVLDASVSERLLQYVLIAAGPSQEVQGSI